MMSEEKKQVGDEAMKKRPNNIDENYNKLQSLYYLRIMKQDN